MKDEFAGQGGSYVFKDGKRVQVEAPTKDHPEGNRPRDADGRPLDAAPEPERPTPAPERPRGGPRKLTALDT
jgi:hypothetical protein